MSGISTQMPLVDLVGSEKILVANVMTNGHSYLELKNKDGNTVQSMYLLHDSSMSCMNETPFPLRIICKNCSTVRTYQGGGVGNVSCCGNSIYYQQITITKIDKKLYGWTIIVTRTGDCNV